MAPPLPRWSRQVALEPLEPRWAPAAAAIRTAAGFTAADLPRGDDNSAPAALGFRVNVFGAQKSEVFINTNGNLSFGGPLRTYAAGGLDGLSLPVLAPFFADIDTRVSGSGAVRFGTDRIDGHDAFAVLWDDVAGYGMSGGTGHRNRFQVVLIDRNDVAPGDFDVEFNYDHLTWDRTGSAAAAALAGFTGGKGGPVFELPGSGVDGAFLAGSPATSLADNRLGSDVPGRFVFYARDGVLSRNRPPAIDPVSDKELLEGQTVEFAVSANDPDGDALTYRLIGAVPAGTSLDPATGRLAFAATTEGDFPLTVAVADPFGHTAAATFTVHVANVAPDFAAGADLLLSRNATLTRAGTFDDPGADPWTATVDYGDGSGVQPLDLAGQTFLLSHPYSTEGSFAVTVSIADGTAVTVRTFHVTVLPDASLVAALATRRFAPGETGTVEVVNPATGQSGQVLLRRSEHADPDGAALVALYSSDPTGGTQAGEFFDVQMRHPHPEDVIEISYQSPLLRQGNVQIRYVDPATGVRVLIADSDITFDRAAGRVTVRIGNPKLLTGTVFTVSLASAPVTTTATVAPPVAQASTSGSGESTRASVALTSRTQLSLTVTAAQDRSLAPTGSTAGVSSGGVPIGSGGTLTSGGTSPAGGNGEPKSADADRPADGDNAKPADGDKADGKPADDGKQGADKPKADGKKSEDGKSDDKAPTDGKSTDKPPSDATPNPDEAEEQVHADAFPPLFPPVDVAAESAAMLDAVFGLAMPLVALGLSPARPVRRRRALTLVP